jgi:hypothetical protein
MSKTEILLTVVNNTPIAQRSALFTNNQVSTSSNTQKYTWNVTSFTFLGQETVSIEQKLVGASSFTISIAPITTLTFQGVCDALNTLGVGTFITYSSGGNTYIAVYSLTYVFGALDIYNGTNILTLTFNGNTFPVSTPTNVSDWNTYFSTNTTAIVPFNSVSIVGNIVNLYGGVGFSLNSIATGLGYSKITSIVDNYTVTSVAISGCQGATILATANLPNCTIIFDSGFDTCSSLSNLSLPSLVTAADTAFGSCTSLTNISLPQLISIGDNGMFNCSALTTIYIPKCLNLGSTTGDNGVFDLIIGNTISLTIPLATSTDGDVVTLQSNNTVTLVTT